MNNFILISFLLLQPIPSRGQDAAPEDKGFRVASCQFPVSEKIGENADWIMKQMKEAADSGAHVAHFPECALSGYPGVDMESLEQFNWTELRSGTEAIMSLARELHMWVILGSLHELGGDLKPMNCLYVIDSSGRIADRYDKRFCTKGDLEHCSAGDHFSLVEIRGVTCGFLICFDVRFPELYREYKKLGAEFIFQSFYNARQKPGGIHPVIMPVTARTRAATNYFHMSLSNSSAASSWPCHYITPDGLVSGKLEADRPGILIRDMDPHTSYYDASRRFRERALQGELSSEEAPVHSRYTNRKAL